MERRDLSDTMLGRFLTIMFDIIVLNILWIVCSLPLFTIGASTTAMYTVLLKVARKENVSTFRDYFSAFKESFGASTICWLIGAFSFAIFVSDVVFASHQSGALKVLFYVIGVLVGALSISVLSWSFPQIAKFNNTTKNYLKNSLLLAFCAPLKTFAIFIMWIAPVALFYIINLEIFMAMGFLYVFMAASLPCYLSSKIAWTVFERVDKSLVQTDIAPVDDET